MTSPQLHLDFSVAEESFPPASRTEAIKDFAQLFELLTPSASDSERQQYLEYTKESGRSPLPGLKRAVDVVLERIPSFDFFGVILPHLCNTVRDLKRIFNGELKLRILRSGESDTVSLTREQAHALLAASFFQRLPEVDDGSNSNVRDSTFGNVAWMSLINSSAVVGVHRLACLLVYFHAAATSPAPSAVPEEDAAPVEPSLRTTVMDLAAKDEPVIRFERISRPDLIPAFEDLEAMRDVPVVATFEQPALIVTATTRIEDVASADAIVDFANKQVQIGCIIPSATQEEIMFSIIPEAMLAVVLFERLRDDEAGLIHGARRFCNYTGYSDGFRFNGPCAPHDDGLGQPPSIVVIDALENYDNQQFENEMFRRDVVKAFMAFRNVRHLQPHSAELVPVVSTGGWGCGVFRGDQTLKFLQQLIAASLAKCKLVYCTFGAQEREHTFKLIAFRLQKRNICVSDVAKWVQEFSASGEHDFEHFVLTKLQ